MKRLIITVAFALAMGCGTLQVGAQNIDTLFSNFQNPKGEALPWCFWYWMYGAVSQEGITADLQAMKHAGLGGTYLMPIYGTDRKPEYGGKAQQLSDEWWKMVSHSVSEADRLGLQLGIHVSDGFALAGGPWITPEESMQKVVFADTVVYNARNIIKQLKLKQPECYKDYYRDIRILAIPATAAEVCDTMPCRMTVSADATLTKGVIRSSKPCYVQFEYDKPFTVRSVEVFPSIRSMQALRMVLMASTDGVSYTKVKEFVPPRSGWQDYDYEYTFAVPETTARYFRLTWTPEGSEPGSESLDAAKWKPNLKVKSLVLHSQNRIDQWQGKSGLVWRIATTPQQYAEGVKTKDIIDLTKYFADGSLKNVKLPKGYWRIMRIGNTSTGHENATAGSGKGLECNKFSREAVLKQINGWFGAIYNHIDREQAKRVITRMHIDSWECGSQNWSDNFCDEFQKRRGYDLMPYLPVMTGVIVENTDKSEEVLRDVRKTISELIIDVFFKTAKAEAEKYNCELSTECVAPTMVSDGLLHYSVSDRPMGEFWLQSPTHDKPNDMLDAISGAHIYGKNIVQAEGFTQLRGHWDETPATVKSLLDCSYSLGINKLFYHVYTHNPWMDRWPGMTLDGIGFYFQRDNTWFSIGAPALSKYAARCQTMLQYGKPVTDIAVYTGDEYPSRAVLPEKVIKMMPGMFTPEKVEAEKERMKNSGQPMTKLSGVGFGKNINRAELWWGAMKGYKYDSVNPDALYNLASVKDGKLVLSTGAEYSALVVDTTCISAQTRQKISELGKQGLNVITREYTSNVLENIAPDLVSADSIVWTHRRGDDADVYFVANLMNENQNVILSFRERFDRKVELWSPMTGKKIDSFSATLGSDNDTDVEFEMTPNESVFIVFGEKEDKSKYMEETNGGAIDVVYEASVKTLPMKLLSSSMYFWNSCYKPDENTLRCPVAKIYKKPEDVFFDWTKSDHKYFSGSAYYSLTAKYPKVAAGQTLLLNLKKFDGVASVKVNGVDCGTVWYAPYTIDVTEAVLNGKKNGHKNVDIEIIYQNSWNNAIKGASIGKAPFSGIWTNANYRNDPFDVIPAGLVEPIEWEVTE